MKEFVELREAWFDFVLKFDPATDDQRVGRKAADINREMKARFDQQTVGIILGKQHCVAPVAPNDLED